MDEIDKRQSLLNFWYFLQSRDKRRIPEPLAEVFGFKINQHVGDVYGTLETHNYIPIYNRSSNNRQCISKSTGDNFLQLTGPAIVIHAEDSFDINVDLVYTNTTDDLEYKIKGTMAWNPPRSGYLIQYQQVYNRPMQEELCSSDGNVKLTMFYAVYKSAVKATVEVFNWGKKKPILVHGIVTVRSSMIPDGDDNESVLFRVDKDQLGQEVDAAVGPGHRIALSRSVVAAPLWRNLTVHVQLYNQRRDDDDLISDILSFPVQINGMSQKKVSGEFSKILVRVTWRHWTERMTESINDKTI